MRTPNNIIKLFALLSLNITYSYADFKNGNFTGGVDANNVPIDWTASGFSFTGYKANLVLPPKSLKDITLTPSTAKALGLTDIFKNDVNQSQDDYFLFGATPTSTLKLPESNKNTAMINLRSQTPPEGVSGTAGKPSNWQKFGKLATQLSQTIKIDSTDITEGSVHIRFKLAAVMENPDHTEKQQPFYAVQINNLTTNPNRDNPLFFQWSYAAQPGIPWKTITKKGTNSGSNATYNYVDWQSFDVDLKKQANVGDSIELVVLAAGCSPGGHDGHVYLDDVTTGKPSAPLSVVAKGPLTIEVGNQIEYEYTFTNNTGGPKDSVCVDAHIPVTQNTSPPEELIFKSYSTTNTTCNYNKNTNIINCCYKGKMANETSEKFSITFDVPENWVPSNGPINNGNFPVYADGYNPVLGNLVQTEILEAPPLPKNSFLVVDVNGLLKDGQPPILDPTKGPYEGTYTCKNTGTEEANPASCNIENLPAGLKIDGCSRQNGGDWPSSGSGSNLDYSIAKDETVTCTVKGIPEDSTSREYLTEISSNAANNINAETNIGSMPFYIVIPDSPKIPATQNGRPVISPAALCCGRSVVVYDIPEIDSDLPATYEIVSVTGSIKCNLGVDSNNKNFVRVYGRPGVCTVIAIKDNQLSQPYEFHAY